MPPIPDNSRGIVRTPRDAANDRLGPIWSSPVSRRQFLGRGLPLLGAAVPLLGLAASCGGSGSSGGGTEALDRPLGLVHDAGVRSLFTPALKRFNQLYKPLSVEFLGIAQNYDVVVQTRFQAGAQGIDVGFSDPGYQELWYENGWIQALDDLPGIETLNADINNPDILRDMKSSKDGKQIAVPYYSSQNLMHSIDSALEDAGVAVPESWDDFEQACAKLKGDGVYDAPFAAFLDSDFDEASYTLISCALSDGMTQLFDASAKPTFDTDPAMVGMLTRLQRMYKNGYIPSASLGSDYTTIFNLYAGNKAAFTIADCESVAAWNDPKSSKVAGKTKMHLMPGRTHATQVWVSKWNMTSTTPNRIDAWELMKYLSWKDKTSQYWVPINVLVGGFGVQAPWTGMASDPAYKKALSFPGMDIDVLQQQIALAKNAFYPGDRENWFSGFLTRLSTNTQLAVLGKTSPEDALKQTADWVRQQQGG
jgi:multiple sugar transport system substrate-binding protein